MSWYWRNEGEASLAERNRRIEELNQIIADLEGEIAMLSAELGEWKERALEAEDELHAQAFKRGWADDD